MAEKISKEIPNEVLDILQYSEESPSGLVWKVQIPRSSKRIGDVAGYLDSKNRWCVKVNKKLYKAHRLIWYIFNKSLDSTLEIDHVDGNPSNNRIENLRLATTSQNNCNKVKLISKGVDLPKGVNFSNSPYTGADYLVARIYVDGKSYSKSGYDLGDLLNWMYSKRTELHGDYSNNG